MASARTSRKKSSRKKTSRKKSTRKKTSASRARRAGKSSRGARRWSQRVTETSDALDLGFRGVVGHLARQQDELVVRRRVHVRVGIFFADAVLSAQLDRFVVFQHGRRAALLAEHVTAGSRAADCGRDTAGTPGETEASA